VDRKYPPVVSRWSTSIRSKAADDEWKAECVETTLGGDPALADHRGDHGPRPGFQFSDPGEHRPAEGAGDPSTRGEGGDPDPFV